MVIKPLGLITLITTANTCNNATLVYLQNTTAGAVLVTTANSIANTSSLYVFANTGIMYQKNSSDTIQGAGINATQISFAN